MAVGNEDSKVTDESYPSLHIVTFYVYKYYSRIRVVN